MLPVAALSNAKRPRKVLPQILVAILFQIGCWSPSLFGQSLQPDASPRPGRVALADSIAEVPAAADQKFATGLIRSDLTQSESEATIEFSVALKMRDFSALKERIARKEVISLDEMAAKYLPTEADYTRVAKWLTAQGIFVKPATQDRLSVFASGTVAQIERILGTKFGRVRMAGSEYTSALKAPSLPNALVASVLGINGLQPHLRPRRHFMALPALQPQKLSNNAPPYTVPEIARAYHVDELPSDGTGQKIGIVIDTFPANSDLTTFWANNGVNQTLGNIEEIQVASGALPSPSGEETLDAEWSSSMAPGAKVRIYATTDMSFVHLDEAYQTIINEIPSQPDLHQISLSFGLGELYEAPSQLQTDSQYFATLAAEGVTIFVSSGDGGSTPGSNGFEDNSEPLQVESPACDPSVTAVGGTSLYLNCSSGSITSECAWSYGGGGQSQVFSRPAWQAGSGMPAGSGRLVPDVAFDADPNTGGYLVLNGTICLVGGTSWGAPCWAGLCARINQGRAKSNQPPLGLLGPEIYPLSPQLGKPDFSEILTGSNGPNGHYNAGPGFDLCTGLGTPNARQLFQSLANSSAIVTAKDFNGDGQADLVLENTVTGQRAIWLLKNGLYSSGYYLPSAPTQWHIAGVGDFLGNGQSDLVWQNLATGECGIWILNKGVFSYSIALPTVQPPWHIAGAADFLGTGQADLVWENTVTGERAIWILNNGAFSYSITLPSAPPQWHIAGAADFLGNGQAGLVLENTTTGDRGIWILNNGAYSYSIMLPPAPPQWHIGGAADFLGTGQADLVWENTTTGELGIWILNSGVYAYTITLPTVSAQWEVVDH